MTKSADYCRIYDPGASTDLPFTPGGLPPDIDPPIPIPKDLPSVQPPNEQERWSKTPIYDTLTYVYNLFPYSSFSNIELAILTRSRTNVPSIAMSFSDIPFPYGPFVPHHIPSQYIASFFSAHKTDHFLSLNTTVEDLSVVYDEKTSKGRERWKLTLRKRDVVRYVDIWWEEEYDAVILANGHYSVPYVGLHSAVYPFSSSLISSLDPTCSRSPRVYGKIPESSDALENLPKPFEICWPENPCSW
jgi:hypothetical protein